MCGRGPMTGAVLLSSGNHDANDLIKWAGFTGRRGQGVAWDSLGLNWILTPKVPGPADSVLISIILDHHS